MLKRARAGVDPLFWRTRMVLFGEPNGSLTTHLCGANTNKGGLGTDAETTGAAQNATPNYMEVRKCRH